MHHNREEIKALFTACCAFLFLYTCQKQQYQISFKYRPITNF